jgi:hypothetical protein
VKYAPEKGVPNPAIKEMEDLIKVAIVANRLVEKWWDNEEPMRSVNRAALRHHLKSVQHLIPKETEDE